MERTTLNTILLMGRPGSGKGTQAKLLSEKLGWIRLSSGDRIKEIRDGSGPLALRVREVFDTGALLPDWFADYVLERGTLELSPHVGVVCEGFGRTLPQAEHFIEIVSWLGRTPLVFNLEVSTNEVRRRMEKRAKTEDRPDSNEATKIEERLKRYDEQTVPALEHLRTKGLVREINGEQNMEDIARDIASVFA